MPRCRGSLSAGSTAERNLGLCKQTGILHSGNAPSVRPCAGKDDLRLGLPRGTCPGAFVSCPGSQDKEKQGNQNSELPEICNSCRLCNTDSGNLRLQQTAFPGLLQVHLPRRNSRGSHWTSCQPGQHGKTGHAGSFIHTQVHNPCGCNNSINVPLQTVLPLCLPPGGNLRPYDTHCSMGSKS